MKIVVFGLSITSSWGNGHATSYRSLLKALHLLGHVISFVEKNVPWYRETVDLPKPEFCKLLLYDSWLEHGGDLVSETENADVIIIGSFYPDTALLMNSLLQTKHCPIIFYDLDTPVTLASLRAGKTTYVSTTIIPYFDVYLSFSGGPILTELENIFHAKRAVAFFCSVDSNIYVPSESRYDFHCDMNYLGTYAADRQEKLEAILLGGARVLPNQSFVVAGSQYPSNIGWTSNTRCLPHVPPNDHPAFYSSSRFTLNLTRQDMVIAGFSPSVRLFEASACGACIISDDWPGLSTFLIPNEEILVATNTQDSVSALSQVSDETRLSISKKARERILDEHTSKHRAVQFVQIVSECKAGGS